ncbi:MFS transporter [Actinomadura atramentaria]|uniref:MFS transporter n=1 Tax=Actinomadura atramentaria TaxID=1990 RepID=UPI00035D6714|nr:MFS transporter [Actinomadura atramentaria]
MGRHATSWLVLACAAQFMVVLDVSVVNVALPAIRTSLDVPADRLPWVAGAYTLAFAGFLLPGGRLADLYGVRRVFVAGLALFTLPSLVGGLAGGPAWLIAARAAQGLGAAVLAPATLTVLTTTFAAGPARTRALAVWTAVGLVGGAAGNLLGGVLTVALSWRWILLVNVPLGAVAAVLAVRLPARRGGGRPGGLDLPGAVTATAGLALLAYGVRGGPAAARALTAAAVLITAFALIEARAAREPLLPPRLLRVRSVAVGNAVMLLTGACFQVPMWYFLTLYMQDVLHYSALRTGFGFLPHTLLTVLVGLRATPRLMERVDGRTLVIAGALLAAAGFAWQARSGGGYLSGVLGPAVPMSLGGGLLTTPLTAIAAAGVEERDAGAASGLLNTAKQVGGALGLAVLTAVPAAATPGTAFGMMAVVMVGAAALSLALPASPDAPGGSRDGRRRGPAGG